MSKKDLKPESAYQDSTLKNSLSNIPITDETYQRMIAEIEDYAIIMMDPEGKILNWNRGAEKIKGYTAEEIVGHNFRIFYPEKDRQELLPDRLIAEAARNNRAQHEGWRVRKDGTKFWGSIVITALHDDDGSIIGFSKVTRDLSERKKAEEAVLRNAHELEAKNKELAAMNQELASFAYVSSHDLQEPLRKIQTFATRIMETEEKTLSDKAKDYFSRMQSAASRMQRLIEDLLTYSRTNTAEKKFETLSLNDVIKEIKSDLKELIDSKKAKITVPDLPQIHGIRFQISQLFTNIFTNALKFSKLDISPEITITSQVVEGSSFGQIANAKKMYHKISVTDNGIGFEPEHKTKIFEVFQRLHGRSEYSGTGIGLAICKKIVENHGGAITADSELDQGATFNVYLPEDV